MLQHFCIIVRTFTLIYMSPAQAIAVFSMVKDAGALRRVGGFLFGGQGDGVVGFRVMREHPVVCRRIVWCLQCSCDGSTAVLSSLGIVVQVPIE